MTIEITNEQDALPLDEERLRKDVLFFLEKIGCPLDLSVAIVTDDRIRDVNSRFLGHDYETDVLAFPLSEAEGEVVVSAERAIEEAGERSVEPLAELMLYVVHGILHLSGYDDHEQGEARRMHETSLNLLREAGYDNTIPDRERQGKERSI